MDASHLSLAAALVTIAVGIGRAASGPLSRAGDGMAALFVPPDRTLGWPHGVQERDEPWRWAATRPLAAADPGTDPGDPWLDGDPATDPWPVPRHGALVVPIGRVAPIHVGVRPH